MIAKKIARSIRIIENGNSDRNFNDSINSPTPKHWVIILNLPKILELNVNFTQPRNSHSIKSKEIIKIVVVVAIQPSIIIAAVNETDPISNLSAIGSSLGPKGFSAFFFLAIYRSKRSVNVAATKIPNANIMRSPSNIQTVGLIRTILKIVNQFGAKFFNSVKKTASPISQANILPAQNLIFISSLSIFLPPFLKERSIDNKIQNK